MLLVYIVNNVITRPITH